MNVSDRKQFYAHVTDPKRYLHHVTDRTSCLAMKHHMTDRKQLFTT